VALSHLKVSPARLSSNGGTVRIRARVAAATRCQLLIRPAATRRSLRKPCRGATVAWQVHLPRNRRAAPTAYRLTVIARGVHQRPVIRHRTVTLARPPTPHLRAVAVSAHQLSSSGGRVRFTARVARTQNCWLTVRPAMEGLPARRHCTGKALSLPVTVPPNAVATPITYHFTIHARGGGTQTATRQRSVTVAPQSPTCPGLTNAAPPTTTAYFNDPTEARRADHFAVVNAMINLICRASPPAGGVATSINLAMYLYELPSISDALIWAHDNRGANIHVVLDGANAETTTSTGVVPNPAYQDLVAGLPSGSVQLCGPNAGDFPLPNKANVRRQRATTAAPASDPTTPPLENGTSCAGDNILHTKLLTVSSIDTAADSAVFTGSQNLSAHGETAAFNNGLQIIGNAPLYRATARYFSMLENNTRYPALGGDLDPGSIPTDMGTISIRFFPENVPAALPPDNSYVEPNDLATDETAELLKTVSCTYPGQVAGDHSHRTAHTTVRIAVYSYSARDLVTQRLVALSRAGCEVQVAYTDMSKATKSKLAAGGVSTMRLSDSTYPLPGGTTGRIFIHDKYLLISGAIKSGGSVVRDQDVLQTGSQNLTQVGLHHNDDEIVRIRTTASERAADTSLFNAYSANWNHLIDVIKSATAP
jgi:phosphatidylserine/phosphatidylglycerophosphate/cardiolipin synthase-like enzyme